MNEIVLTSGALASAVLQLIKFGWRKFVVKDPTYDFPKAFYAIMLPVLNALAPFALVFIGFPSTDPILSLDVRGVVLFVVRILVSSVVSIVLYDGAKSFITYDPEVENN